MANYVAMATDNDKIAIFIRATIRNGDGHSAITDCAILLAAISQ